MLRKCFAILFFLTACQFVASSQTAHSLLWEISGNHLSKPSYLYGTMHSRDKRAHQFGDSVLTKLNECDAVALEILTSDMTANPFAMLSYIMMKDTTLDMLLSKEDYQLVKKYASENLGMYGMLIDKMMPIFTATLLTELQMGNDKETTVDEFLEKTAFDKGKKAIGIETVDEQLNALNQISLKEQAEMLVEQLQTQNKDSVTFEKLMECYRVQDLPCLHEIYTTEDVSDVFDKALIDTRNHTMAHRIDSIIHLQPTFVAVGALHLAGDVGLIKLLEQTGYSVTPVFSVYKSDETITSPEK